MQFSITDKGKVHRKLPGYISRGDLHKPDHSNNPDIVVRDSRRKKRNIH